MDRVSSEQRRGSVSTSQGHDSGSPPAPKPGRGMDRSTPRASGGTTLIRDEPLASDCRPLSRPHIHSCVSAPACGTLFCQQLRQTEPGQRGLQVRAGQLLPKPLMGTGGSGS